MEGQLILCQFILPGMRVAQINPVQIPVGILEGIGAFYLLDKITGNLIRGFSGAIVTTGKPTVCIEGNRGKESFPSQMVEGLPFMNLAETKGQDNQSPFAFCTRSP